MSDNVSNKIMVYFVALFGKLSLAALSIYGTTVVCLSTSFLRRMNMKAARLVAGFVCGALCLAAFSGCETRQSACEREKRLTEQLIGVIPGDRDGEVVVCSLPCFSQSPQRCCKRNKALVGQR